MTNEVFETNTSGRPASDLISALRGRAPRAALTLAAIQASVPIAKATRDKLRESRAYTVKMMSTDDLYDDVHEWVLGMVPLERRRSLIAWTSSRGGDMMAVAPFSDGMTSQSRLRLRYDGSRHQHVTVDGHRIRVEVTEGEMGKDHGLGKPDQIIFTTTSVQARDTLLSRLDGLRRTERRPKFRMVTSWGDWTTLADLPARTTDSVILPQGQMERLISDVQRFLDSEAEYLRRSIPWHRGHLYEGVPGTGKTSVARAIAHHFGMDVWYLPLADVDKDTNLLSAVSRITPRSMLLLEDVDVFHAARTRDDEHKGMTLSGLLNALDGIATPHGLFTVLTTNTPDVLDEAIVRPGRVDLVEHFGLADHRQISRLVERWYDRKVDLIPDAWRTDVSPAAVVEICKGSNFACAITKLMKPEMTS